MREEIANNLSKTGYIKPTFLRSSGLTKEECYNIYYNVTEIPKCPVCGNKPNFGSFISGYKTYCGMNCANSGKWTTESKENANKKRAEYYTANPEKKKERSEKIARTNEIVWASGTELRIKQTLKVKEGIGFSEINRKGKITKLEKYGYSCDFSTDYFKNIMLEKYGG